ncbi:hypothetical protein BH23GEM2_BH23GEM2_09560 [soil metagenome]
MTFSAQLARATLLPLFLAGAAACNDSTEPPRPTSLQATSPVSQQAPAGTAVAQPPSVVVRDQNGTPMPSVSVSFATVAGGGSISPASVTSDANGAASLTSWTLGPNPGTNVVTATIGTAQVTFSAEGIRVPAFMDFMSPPHQQVVAGTTLQGQPAVAVRDQAGQLMAGVTVTFTVTSGSSTVNPVTVVTGAQGTFDWGIARATSWHVPAPGTHTVAAAVPGLAPVTFTVNAVDPAVCDPVAGVTVPGAIAGALSTSDCPLPTGEYVDFYVLEVTARSIVRFRAVSSAVDTYLILLTSAGRPVAENDDDGASRNSEMVAVLGPGTYHVGVTSFGPGETGAYTLTTDIAPEGGARDCLPFWFVMKGATVSGTLAPSQCAFDLYVVFLAAGETVQITMSSSAVDAYLVFEDANFNLIENDNHGPGTTDARITYTAPVPNFYLFGATSAQLAAGAYTLTID